MVKNGEGREGAVKKVRKCSSTATNVSSALHFSFVLFSHFSARANLGLD